jgi:hypothetical protein
MYKITGGTGQFSGAQGSFTMKRMASATAFITIGSFSGTITLPGAAN